MTYGFPGQERSPEREKEAKKNSAEERECDDEIHDGPGIDICYNGK